MKHAPNMMDTSLEELRGLIERLDSRRLDEDDYPVVANVVATVMYLKQVHDDKSMSIKRLLDLLFGSVSSEKTDKLLAQLEAAFAQMQTPIAVRSSAVGEDSEAASFAGQHATVLNVMTFSQLISAIAEVVQSALSPSAMSYREKLGVVGGPSMGVVLQELFTPDSAGVNELILVHSSDQFSIKCRILLNRRS